MIETLLDILSWILLLSGSFFCLTGALGLLRFPDFFTRTHATGITDTMGAGLILIGLMLQASNWIVFAKLIIITLFSFMAATTACHAMSKAAIKSGLKPQIKDHPGRDSEEQPSKL
ncbi:MAG TPA: monovalent cation/H(+) antiporter subunit G [Desulfopila sp.]|nr:monovalent cation/H(+) antiporter subunit G [Desulfopila sp.]